MYPQFVCSSGCSDRLNQAYEKRYDHCSVFKVFLERKKKLSLPQPVYGHSSHDFGREAVPELGKKLDKTKSKGRLTGFGLDPALMMSGPVRRSTKTGPLPIDQILMPPLLEPFASVHYTIEYETIRTTNQYCSRIIAVLSPSNLPTQNANATQPELREISQWRKYCRLFDS